MPVWNFADVWEAIASARPDQLAVVQGTRRVSWADFNSRGAAIGHALVEAGLPRQAKVAQYLTNCPEYLESVFGAFKASLVPVNTNYRYGDDELVYLWDNADIEAVIFESRFVESVDRVRRRLPNIRVFLFVGDPTTCPTWAVPYEELANMRPGPQLETHTRSGDDLLLLYTGGTTGTPKGVMWRQDDLFALLNRAARVRYPDASGVEAVPPTLAEHAGSPPVLLAAPPLMHGTGALSAFSTMNSGGTVVLLESSGFRSTEALDAIQRERASEVAIVGDAFAKPLLEELDAQPSRWDISSLWMIFSSGMVFSAEVKRGLLRHNPKLLCIDSLGSTEAPGIANARSSSSRSTPAASFQLGPASRVIDDEGRDLVPGSDDVGMLAISGRMPLGYYKDPIKTEATFRTIDGVRWAISGDMAKVDENGMATILGRGSLCINTGGEKVFSEEVEEVLKLHPAVADAVVLGIPDHRFGEAIVALVEPKGQAAPDERTLIGHVKTHLAGYKAPRYVLRLDSIGRADNGKLDYQALRQLAEATITTNR